MSYALKNLVLQLRSAKSFSQENKIVAEERARLLSQGTGSLSDFSERIDFVSKLVYFDMLGHPTVFGQMEVLALAASPLYSQKRIGYLGLTSVFTEQSSVLLLTVQQIKKDCVGQNSLIAGTALQTLGNIGSTDMLSDLATEVMRLLAHDNLYIRKRAFLCGARVLRKLPELAESFEEAAFPFLNTKTHSGLSALVSLLRVCLEKGFTDADEEGVSVSLDQSLAAVAAAVVALSDEKHVEICLQGKPFLVANNWKRLRNYCAAAKRLAEHTTAIVATNSEGHQLRGVNNPFLLDKTLCFIGELVLLLSKNTALFQKVVAQCPCGFATEFLTKSKKELDALHFAVQSLSTAVITKIDNRRYAGKAIILRVFEVFFLCAAVRTRPDKKDFKLLKCSLDVFAQFLLGRHNKEYRVSSVDPNVAFAALKLLADRRFNVFAIATKWLAQAANVRPVLLTSVRKHREAVEKGVLVALENTDVTVQLEAVRAVENLFAAKPANEMTERLVEKAVHFAKETHAEQEHKTDTKLVATAFYNTVASVLLNSNAGSLSELYSLLDSFCVLLKNCDCVESVKSCDRFSVPVLEKEVGGPDTQTFYRTLLDKLSTATSLQVAVFLLEIVVGNAPSELKRVFVGKNHKLSKYAALEDLILDSTVAVQNTVSSGQYEVETALDSVLANVENYFSVDNRNIKTIVKNKTQRLFYRNWLQYSITYVKNAVC